MPDQFKAAVVRGFTFIELAADRRTAQHLLEPADGGDEGVVAKACRAGYSPGAIAAARLFRIR